MTFLLLAACAGDAEPTETLPAAAPTVYDAVRGPDESGYSVWTIDGLEPDGRPLLAYCVQESETVEAWTVTGFWWTEDGLEIRSVPTVSACVVYRW